MITKFKIFENNNSDYLINNLSEECLLKLGFKISYTGYYHLNLLKDYNIFDNLFIHNNKIFLEEFNNPLFLIDNDKPKTTKVYIDKYLEYYDYIKNGVMKKYVVLSFYNNTFIPKQEYAKIVEKDYKKYSSDYIDKLNENEIVKYKENFDKVIDLIRLLESDDKNCKKKFAIKSFNI